MLGHPNINSLRNKFESITGVIQGTFDIFLLSGTKIDEKLPDKQFCLNNFRIYQNNFRITLEYNFRNYQHYLI